MQTISSPCRIVTIFLVATFMLFAGAQPFQTSLHAQDVEPELNVRFKSDRSTPLPPLESLNNFVLAEGFRVELVACEPQVIDPVSARFDSLGRLWVVEMRDYPFIPEGEQPQGQIRVLEDRDHDGHFEAATTFASPLVDPTGLAFFRDGIIATLAGKIVWLRDTDGDLKADQEEIWFEGFTTENEQLRANHPTWLVNGRIHVASGLRGGEIRSQKPQWSPLSSPVNLAGRDFEFSPWSSAWGAVEGNSQFGFWQDSSGNSYACSNRNPCRLLLATPQQAARNPLIPLSAWASDVMPAAENSRVYSLVDTFTTSHLHTGQFTAACAVYRYESNLLGPSVYGSYFACEPTASIVQQAVIAKDIIAKQTKRADSDKEFIASRDPWFRPVDLFDGPDGAMYVVDMHRAIIEHPDWVPPQWKDAINNRSGNQAGRIYRIVPDTQDTSKTHSYTTFVKTTDASLLTLLGSANRWEQEHAMRLLLEQCTEANPRFSPTDLARQLRSLLVTDAPAPLWIRGIGLLDGLSELEDTTGDDEFHAIRQHVLQKASNHPVAEIRLQGARHSTADNRLQIAADDESPHVRFAWILHASQWLQSGDKDALMRLVNASMHDDPRDREWIGRAISLTDASVAPPLIAALSQHAEDLEPNHPTPFITISDLLAPWFEKLGWQGDSETLATLLGTEAWAPSRSLVDAYLRGASRRGSTMTKFTASLSETQKQKLVSLLQEAADQVSNPDLGIEERSAALQILSMDDTKLCESTLRPLLMSEQSEFLLAAWEKLAPKTTIEDTKTIASRLDAISPTLAVRLIEMLSLRADSSETLLGTVEQSPSLRGFLSPTAWERLKRHTQEPLKSRIQTLWSSTNNTNKATVISEYVSALQKEQSPVDRSVGAALFRKHCASCHRIDAYGYAVGPDISDMRTQTPEQIIHAILTPNAAIDANYFRYQVITTSGQLIEGLLLDQNQSGVTLKQQDAKSTFIPREEIEQARTSPLSMMPEGFEQSITPSEMFQLVDYLKNWRFQ